MDNDTATDCNPRQSQSGKHSSHMKHATASSGLDLPEVPLMPLACRFNSGGADRGRVP